MTVSLFCMHPHSLMMCLPNHVFLSVQEGLLAVWEMDSWLPFVGVRRQRRKLIRQLGYIYTSDWLMKLEGGVDSLSHDALSEVLGVLYPSLCEYM